ncbi:hypothetical protein ACNKHK_26330 [Shigella flexneri]
MSWGVILTTPVSLPLEKITWHGSHAGHYCRPLLLATMSSTH